MVRNCILVFLFCLSASFVNAQANVLNAKSADEIGKRSTERLEADNDGPIPYGYVDDRDIMWSKVVWEFVDLNQKINLPYYFPIDTTSISSDRRSLFDTLIKGIRQGKIKEAYTDSFFTSKITQDEIDTRLVNIRDENGYVDTFNLQTEDVAGYMLKGMWYFDKRQGEMKYRLLALAPMGKDVQTLGVENIEDDNLYELFWIFFPDAREVLHDSKVFNPMNASQPISYDHLLNARRFNSVIVREENIYGNRAIEDYIRGNSLFQLLEANKIKEDIRNREIDMWNY
ncbi:gliding motility protein GldN [Polaribacter dokdonensis]|jgi:gliding motility associated protien GldN|uniref:Gliding motility protein GldO n=1 Tax=Polaribacter dokdonensis DSW-5 TaxID=1300348 RepID=A0A0N0CEZ4_9FLAO|nr:gliding motility protein GldN [Polaribacter dokdonensis]KOY51150.1 Gliding motility protein GldO [Polaribacter dokdonensis DSW-5]SEE17582.1 protein involved in gliding motility GldN [Polaribacter dokdonensis DSW-5]